MIIDDMETIPGKLGPVEIGIFHPGEILCGRYEVLSQLGKGGMGIVYKCLDKTSGKSVALKTLAPELIQNHYEMELTKDNFNLVSELHHPYIANYNALEFDNIHGGYYLIMEFVDGEDIRYYLRRMKKEGANPEQLILRLLRQAAEALDYAHTKKVVHKDIKPANMMVDRDGNLKLLDFGLAAKIHSSMSMTTLRNGQEEAETSGGTLMYMSPEQLAGKWDKPTMDQYSLAAAAYELFSGHTPFNAPDRDSLKTSIREEVPEPLEDVSSSIVNAISKALSKKPEDRFASCTAFADALEDKTVPKPVPEPEKLSDSELVECLTLKINISSFFSSYSNEYFKAERDELQRKFDRCKDDPMSVDLLKAFRNIFASCEEMQKNAGVCQEVLKKQQNLEDLEQFLKSNNISFPKEYHGKKTVADQLLGMKRYEAAGGVLSELCTLLSKEKELYEKKRKAEEEKKRQAEEAKRKAEEEACRNIKLPGGHVLEMVQIEPGTFIMGSPENELCRCADEKQHQVTLTKRFYLGKYPVTQKEYQAVMGNNPSHFKGDNLPVEKVSWYDAKRFCSKLNDLKRDELPAGYRFDLPTDAQWEYACRAGTTTALNNGLNLTSEDGRCLHLDEVAWYWKNSDRKTHPVGQKKPNAWGLYDMHGNVYEWCNDWKAGYPSRAVTDPTGPASGSRRVIHGGSWYSTAQRCRSAGRRGSDPTYRCYDVGFRVALVRVD